jgi:hypothetical protein
MALNLCGIECGVGNHDYQKSHQYQSVMAFDGGGVLPRSIDLIDKNCSRLP